jgi:hypothetical protein
MRKIYFSGAIVIIVLLIVFLMSAPIPVQKPRIASISTTSAQTVLGQTTKTAGCAATNGLPDTACTPGGVSPAVTQDTIHSTICVSGYSASVRPPESVTNKIKKERLVAYGDAGSMSDYELDHLISLELGGCPDCVANLWPEPYNILLGAHQKDKVENYLHKEVCNGTITLRDAQETIATDWESVYNRLPQN